MRNIFLPFYEKGIKFSSEPTKKKSKNDPLNQLRLINSCTRRQSEYICFLNFGINCSLKVLWCFVGEWFWIYEPLKLMHFWMMGSSIRFKMHISRMINQALRIFSDGCGWGSALPTSFKNCVFCNLKRSKFTVLSHGSTDPSAAVPLST